MQDVRAKICLKLLPRSDDELLVSEIQNNGAHRLFSEIKSIENLPDFEKLAHVILYFFLTQWLLTLYVVGNFPQGARSMHDVAQRCDMSYVRSKDARKQISELA